jgi:transposase
LAKLTESEIVTIEALSQRGQSASQTARLLGVTEGTVRYHRRRLEEGAADGRRKPLLIERLGLEEVVTSWWQQACARLVGERPPSVELLWEHLRREHGYGGSYKSVRKYARRRFGEVKLRPYRRVETPPGAQAQTDWGEFRIELEEEAEGRGRLYAFVMTLSHSRREAVIWSRRVDQLAWHRCHNEAFRRLGGVAAVNRIDNLKTGVSRGSGAWGKLNEQYRRYARSLGFHIDACEARSPEQKGKTERRVGSLRQLGVSGRRFSTLAELQAWTDAALAARSARLLCPATGKTVAASWEAERSFLRPLPEPLPEPFDLVRTCRVHKDCTVAFEGRRYVVPFAYAGGRVEARGCSGVVQIVDLQTGVVLVTYPRHTSERILIDERCYAGGSTDRVAAPKPLGRMSRKLAELAATPVERRPVDLYAALAEVAR